LLLAMPRSVRERVVGALLGRGVRFRFVASCYREALLTALSSGLAAALERSSVVEAPRVEVDGLVGLPRREARVVVLARLIPDKRVHLAIEATASLPGVSLVVAGDGPERPRLEQLARALAPGRVQFLGQIARPEALALLASSAVLVHPSAIEAAPTAILEALALSTPVVACDAGDVAHWACSDPRLTVVSPRADGLARALEQALAGAVLSPRNRGSRDDA
jgi:glycosyltransferase involved in cell wall biosynthesis